MMMIRLRPLDLKTDAPRYAELMNSVNPEPVTLERLQEWERDFPADGIRRRMVALDDNGSIVGYNQAAHWPHMLPQSYYLEQVVAPECRRQGIGTRLYQDAAAFSLSQGATRLETEVRDHNPEWLAFAQARGFHVDRHVFESTLDLATFDHTRFAGVIESVQAQGIRFASLAEVGDTPENRRKLYETNRSCALDIPGSEGTFPRLKDFNSFVFGSSWFRAQGQILAIDGERFIGLGAVGYFIKTNSAYNMHTGVLKEYRGRKIALALKLLAIRLAQAWGAVYLRTNNDSQNAPILAINRKLGYQPQPGYYRCLKELSAGI